MSQENYGERNELIYFVQTTHTICCGVTLTPVIGRVVKTT